jgi:tetratricopeptide (TPR) repeat protein
MLGSMRVPMLVLAILILAAPMQAQESASDSIVRAFGLWRGGQPKAAIAILEPLLRAGSSFDDPRDPGVGWNVLGHSYLDLDHYAEARQAYQHAMEILRQIPSARAQYASTLDSMGMLETSLGQKSAGETLCGKARRIYAELGDSTGVAITSINLAVIAVGRNDFKSARRFVQTAIQSQPETAMKADDVAAMDEVRSALAMHDGKREEAISMAQRGIDLWTRAHGPGYFLLSSGYLLRAQVLAHFGDYAGAIGDAQHGLAIAENAVGRNSIDYVSAQVVYAGILRASGAKREGSRMAKEAGSALAEMERRQCSGCTIDANGFR